MIYVLISVISLAIASYWDLKERLVPDIIWKFQITLGLTCFIIELSIHPINYIILNILVTILWVGSSMFVGIVMYKSKAWGGADSMAIISLSLSNYAFINPSSQLSEHEFFPPVISILGNILFIIVNLSILNFVYNIILMRYYRCPDQRTLISQNLKCLISCRILPYEGSIRREKTQRDGRFDKMELPGIPIILIAYLLSVARVDIHLFIGMLLM